MSKRGDQEMSDKKDILPPQKPPRMDEDHRAEEERPLVQNEADNGGNTQWGTWDQRAVEHPYLATVSPGPVMGQIMCQNPRTGNYDPWAPVYNEGQVVEPCRICGSADQPETLFNPCNCPGVVHRHCFRKWRQGWINPRNYFNCPNCMFKYNIERIRNEDLDKTSETQIRRNFKIQLIKLLLTVFFIYCATVAIFGFGSYGMDTENKNIPVAVKYMMTSVVSGIPNSNTTELWEDNFKKADVRVWPYYTLFGILITSIIILLVFCLMGCTFDNDDKRQDKRCCEDCDDCCGGNSGGYYGNNCYCYQPIDCNCGDCGDCGDCDCNGCGDCDCGDCKCDGNVGEAAIILLLVVIVAVILSAIFVIIFYTLQKTALLYDRMSHMLLSQSKELEGETIVLGKNETWRPLDAV